MTFIFQSKWQNVIYGLRLFSNLSLKSATAQGPFSSQQMEEEKNLRARYPSGNRQVKGRIYILKRTKGRLAQRFCISSL